MSLQNVRGFCMSQHKGETSMTNVLIANGRLWSLWIPAQIKWELVF